MKYPDKRFLFTVTEISKACGVSRATLLRMEEDGFLTPYQTDPDTGYRYYDANNITQIGQYQMLQELGLSRKEIAAFYFKKTDPSSFLAEQRKKLDKMARILDGLEMRYTDKMEDIFSFVNLPETTCFCFQHSGSSPEEGETLAYSQYQGMVKEGFCANGTEPFFVLMGEGAPQSLHQTTICFPIRSGNLSDPRVRTFPACKAFSMSWHGDYDSSVIHIEKFWKEFSARGLKPAGPARLLSLVAPYVGEHFKTSEFCYEIVVPV